MIYPKTEQNGQDVALHYDELDQLYRYFWGTHLHHGYWKSPREKHHQAVQNLVELLAELAEVKPGMQVCDIGCGYGETARMLAEKWQAQTTGLTISQEQYRYAMQQPQTSPGNPDYILGDWLKNTLPTNQFHAALAIESSEHMPDKPAFFEQAYRVLAPNGKLLICAWLSTPSPTRLEKRFLLEPICRESCLPSMGTAADYVQWLSQAGFGNIQFYNLSNKVKKTWSICAQRVLKAFICDPQFRKTVKNPAVKNRHFAKTVFRIWLAYQLKSMQYGLFIAEKDVVGLNPALKGRVS